MSKRIATAWIDASDRIVDSVGHTGAFLGLSAE